MGGAKLNSPNARKKAEEETLKRARDDSVCIKRKRFSLSCQKNECTPSAKKAKITKDSSKRESHKRNECLRKPSLTQVAPNSSTGKQPLDPEVESAYCEKTFPVDKLVESFSSERVLPLDSAFKLVSSENTLPLDPPVPSITQEKPPLHIPVEPSEAQVSEKRGANEEKITNHLESAVELVFSENTLTPDLTFHFNTQKKPLQDPPVPFLAQEKSPLHTLIEPAKAPLSRGASEEKSTNCLESVVPLESAVELVSSEKTLPPDPTFHSITQEKPLLGPPSDPTFHFIIQEKPPLHNLIEPAKAPLSDKRGANKKKITNLPRKKITFDLEVKTYEQVGERYSSSDDEIEEETVPKSRLLLSPTCVTFPLNHRYQNCDIYGEIEELEEEEEEEGYYFSDDEEVEGSDELDEVVRLDEIGNRIEGNDESYESFFPLSTDKETELLGVHIRDRSHFVYPVLNPVENISQWKQAKANLSGKATKKDKAMNTNLYKENKGDELSVDTSLSSWLGSTDNSKVEKGQVGNLSVSWEDRLILGARTMEDFRESSVNSSPRLSPIRIPTPDDYWYSGQLLELQ